MAVVVRCILVLTAAFAPLQCAAFYLPGVAPQDFREGDSVEIKAVKMTSVKTQLPYEYYSLPFCEPENKKILKENLGEKLRGDRLQMLPYKLLALRDMPCQLLCEKSYTADQVKQFTKRIKDNYLIHWVLDNLPSGVLVNKTDGTPSYLDGFPLGIVGSQDFNDKRIKDGRIYVNTHVAMRVYYHAGQPLGDAPRWRIVGFEVHPISMTHDGITSGDQDADTQLHQCTLTGSELQELPANEDDVKVRWTYSVDWVESDIAWASRWDLYLNNFSDDTLHWVSTLHSLGIILLLGGIVALIIVRTLRKDIAKYNEIDMSDDVTAEESGWKLVHADVFRPPRYLTLLCACLCSGLQVLGTGVVVLTLSMMGFLSPASRGSFMQMSLASFVLSGLFAGYMSGRVYKTCKGKDWKNAALMSAGCFPTCVLVWLIVLNFMVMTTQSSGAAPLSAMMTLLVIYASLYPLVLLGFSFGYRKKPYEYPVRTNQIPRQVPDQPWYMRMIPSILMAGLLPFGAVFVEFYFVFSAIWQNQIYYLFGFLFLVFIILIICVAELSIVMVYFQLCAEDYNWWWRSIAVGGGSSIYVFLYSVYYFNQFLDITGLVSIALYFSYTLLMCLVYALLTGTLAFFVCYKFLRKIYAEVRVD